MGLQQFLRRQRAGAFASGRPVHESTHLRPGGGGAGQDAIQHGSQLLSRGLRVHARTYQHAHGQEWPPGGDGRYWQAAVGPGCLQRSDRCDGCTGVRHRLRATVADCRGRHRFAAGDVEPGTPRGRARRWRGCMGSQQGDVQDTGLHALLSAELSSRRARRRGAHLASDAGSRCGGLRQPSTML